MQWTSVIQKRVSTDLGYTWGPLETIMPTPGSFCRNRVEVLSNGDWLLPMYYSKKEGEGLYGNDVSVVQISSDEGKTWVEYPFPNSRGRVHPTVLELEPGSLVAFMRSRSADRIYESRSTDYGRTWSQVVRTALPNNNASIQAVKLAGGSIALAFNYLQLSDNPETTIWSNERYPLTIALSDDGGKTWPFMRHIDTGDGFFGEMNKHHNRSLAYPSIFQSRDGFIHVAYSYLDRECIKYVRVDEDWIRQKRSRFYS